MCKLPIYQCYAPCYESKSMSDCAQYGFSVGFAIGTFLIIWERLLTELNGNLEYSRGILQEMKCIDAGNPGLSPTCWIARLSLSP